MREIKFRAWHPEEKKMWIDVGTDGCGVVILDTKIMGLKPLKGESILMQYTGRKDRNGKEAYHKDILRDCKTGNLWVIEWDDEWARFTLVPVKAPFHERDKHRLMVFLKRMEYEGNIYENPELLT